MHPALEWAAWHLLATRIGEKSNTVLLTPCILCCTLPRFLTGPTYRVSPSFVSLIWATMA